MQFIDPSELCSQDSSGNFQDSDDGGTFQFSGPCVQGNNATAQQGSWLDYVVARATISSGGDRGSDGTPVFTATGTATTPVSSKSRSVSDQLACAASFGKNHSIASFLGVGNNYAANLFGGNSLSGLANLYFSVAANGPVPDFAKLVAGGGSLGVPVNDALRLTGGETISGFTSVTGTIRATALRSLFNAATQPASLASLGGEVALQGGITAAEYASGAAIAKFAFDSITFGYGYFACGN